MVCSEDGPRGASTEPKRIGLLVEREESLADESVPELPDLARLLLLHFRNCATAATLQRRLAMCRRKNGRELRRSIYCHGAGLSFYAGRPRILPALICPKLMHHRWQEWDGHPVSVPWLEPPAGATIAGGTPHSGST